MVPDIHIHQFSLGHRDVEVIKTLDKTIILWLSGNLACDSLITVGMVVMV